MGRNHRAAGLLAAMLIPAAMTVPAAAAPAPSAAAPAPLVTQVADINPDGDSLPQHPVVVDDVLYFAASDPQHGRQIWAYDAAGAAGGGRTYRVTDLPKPGLSMIDDDLVALDGGIYFAADTTGAGGELFEYDPATEETRLVADIDPGPEGSSPQFLTLAGGKLYFAADGRGLWEYDSDNDAVRLVLPQGPLGTIMPGLGVDSALYLVISDGRGNTELFVYDTTTTRDLRQLTTFPGSAANVGSSLATAYGLVYFTGYSREHGEELYVYDPATGRVSAVPEPSPGPADSSPHDIVALDGDVYFVATGPVVGQELWRFDPATRTVQLAADIEPANVRGHRDSQPVDLTVIDGRLFFTANRTELADAPLNRELWVFDPRAAGGGGAASMVDDLYFAPNFDQSGARNIDATVAYDGALFSAGRIGSPRSNDGFELLRYDPRPTELAAVLYGEREVSAPGTLQVTAYLRNNTEGAVSGRLRLEVVGPDGVVTAQSLPGTITIPGRDVATVEVPVSVPIGSLAGSYLATLTLVGPQQRLGADTVTFAVG